MVKGPIRVPGTERHQGAPNRRYEMVEGTILAVALLLAKVVHLQAQIIDRLTK